MNAKDGDQIEHASPTGTAEEPETPKASDDE